MATAYSRIPSRKLFFEISADFLRNRAFYEENQSIKLIVYSFDKLKPLTALEGWETL